MRHNAIPGLTKGLTSLGVGTSPLGSHMTNIYGADVDDEQAHATIESVLSSPIRFIDTANAYGAAEQRIGNVIKRGLPNDFVVATKADPSANDFSGNRVLDSFAESARRLGLPRFHVYFLHDPEDFDFDYLSRPGGAVDAMVELKRNGSVDLIGIAGGDIQLMSRFVELGLWDVVLNHNRFTLLDRTADSLIDLAVSADVAFINAAPYASGLLAKAPSANATYRYRPPEPGILRRVEYMRGVCEAFGTSLPAVALRFSTRDPRIVSTIVGVSRPEQVIRLLADDVADIPDELWAVIEDALGDE